MTVTVPAPLPELVIVPALFTVVSVIPAASPLLFASVRLPVPLTPTPLTVSALVPRVFVSVVPPELTTNPPLKVSAEVVLPSVTLVTFAPTAPLIVVVPAPLPELMIVPWLLTPPAPDRVITPAPVELNTRLPMPVTPPLKVSAVVAGDRTKSCELSVTRPLKVLTAVPVIAATPALPEATEIALANGPANPPLSVALAETVESPSVIAPAPNALALVVPLTVPALIVRPPVKVFTPLNVNVPLPILVRPTVPLPF